jgi:hypothetical protein
MPGGPGDGRGSGVGLQRSGVGEPGSVVADLSEHPRAGRVRQTGKTRDNCVVGMLLEQLRSSLAEVLHAGAGGVERREQSQ